MRLSEEAKRPVQPAHFWMAVAAVSVLVGGMGIYQMVTGQVPAISPWCWVGALGLVWAVAIFHLLRYGRQAFPWLRVAFLIGYTLFAIENLLPHPPEPLKWAAGAGLVAMMASALGPFIEFGKPEKDVTVDLPPNAPPTWPQ